MGEMADYYYEQALAQEFLEELEPDLRKLRRKIWTTKDGREIKVKDMTTEHIANALAYVIRNHGEKHLWVPVLKKELNKR